jgi:hypothetical protein
MESGWADIASKRLSRPRESLVGTGKEGWAREELAKIKRGIRKRKRRMVDSIWMSKLAIRTFKEGLTRIKITLFPERVYSGQGLI